jgi:hypothetical protein
MVAPVTGTDRLIPFFAKTLMFSPEKYHLRRKIRRHLTANDTTLKRQRLLLSYLLLEKGVFYIRQIALAEM